MEAPTKISPYLLPEWWEKKLAGLLNPTESSLEWKMPFSLRHGHRGYSWYEKNGFVLGYSHEKARKRPKFILSYKPEEHENWLEYDFTFEQADVFMDFLEAMGQHDLLPICITLDPALKLIETCLGEG